MTSFPPEIRFRLPWRPYQARTLKDFDQHIADGKLHVVAAPGSGKTVLGIEAALRINKPALVLSPTLTIRDQWRQRFVDLFMPEGSAEPDWITTDIRNPGLLTITTYQALHCAIKGLANGPDEQDDDEAECAEDDDESVGVESIPTHRGEGDSPVPANVIEALKTAGVETLVVDEAHHLKASWWKSLEEVRKGLGDPHVIALTATPPYDVPIFEWERYKGLCGAVDVEIGAPEMVREGNLCPHQDYICLTQPTPEERELVTRFHTDVAHFVDLVRQSEPFRQAVSAHPWIMESEKNIESILTTPAYFSSLVVFLYDTELAVPPGLLDILCVGKQEIPKLDLEWMDELLTSTLYFDPANYETCASTMEFFESELKRIGAMENRRVNLRTTQRIQRLFANSTGKIDAIVHIARMECGSLSEGLRLVVLTDFIRRSELPRSAIERSAPRRLGVASIFDALRRAAREDFEMGSIGESSRGDLRLARVGALSGSLVILPRTAMERMAALCREEGVPEGLLRIEDTPFDTDYVFVSPASGFEHSLTRIVTRLFEEGEVTALVGTKALLGEGWDAPTINSLILASNVGSFVMSNQMRGRAIRSCPTVPDKTANVWHIACIDEDSSDGGPDYDCLVRRFKTFAGPAIGGEYIENGIARLGVAPPFATAGTRPINASTFSRAMDREGLSACWRKLLATNADASMVEEVRAKPQRVPRAFAIRRACPPLFGAAITAAAGVGVFAVPFVANMAVPWIPMALGAALSTTGTLLIPRYIRLLRMHGRIENSFRWIGVALLDALVTAELVKTDRASLSVTTRAVSADRIDCCLEGGTSYEKALFLDCIEEMLSPIDNPRYMIIKEATPDLRKQDDYYAVPGPLGMRKEWAAALADNWRKLVGPVELMYTRTVSGRLELLRAREHCVDLRYGKNTERVNCWK